MFFAGCMGDKVYPNVTEACLKIFRARGVGVRMPSSLACCGIPALASGDAESFKKMLSYNLSKLEGEKFDYAVTACASCTETIEKFWPQYAEGKQKAQAERIAAKTLDISAFVVDVLGIEPAKAPVARREKVTYHDSCHLAKSLGVRSQPRKLVEANPGCELVEMREPDRCCGLRGELHAHALRAVEENRRAQARQHSSQRRGNRGVRMSGLHDADFKHARAKRRRGESGARGGNLRAFSRRLAGERESPLLGERVEYC